MRRGWMGAAGLGLLWAAMAGAGATLAQDAAPATPRKTALALPEGEGMAQTKSLCVGCHGLDVIVKQKHDRDGWNKVVDAMVAKGMDASDGDLNKVVAYLTAHFGAEAAAAPSR